MHLEMSMHRIVWLQARCYVSTWVVGQMTTEKYFSTRIKIMRSSRVFGLLLLYSYFRIYTQENDKSCVGRTHIGCIQVIFHRIFFRLLSLLCYIFAQIDIWIFAMTAKRVRCRKRILAYVVGSYNLLSQRLNRIQFRFPTYGCSSNDMRIMALALQLHFANAFHTTFPLGFV